MTTSIALMDARARRLRGCVARAASELGRVGLLCGTTDEPTNAILEYTQRMNGGLRSLGVDSHIVTAFGASADLNSLDTIVLQYNPFLYGRWGFAPRLLNVLSCVRVKGRPRVAMMLHETHLPISHWRTAAVGSWQRVQLRAVHAASEVVFASIEPWADMIARWRPRRPAWHLPVGSNLPDATSARDDARRDIEAAASTMVVVSFGTGHPSRLMDHVVLAANHIAKQRDDVVLLNLGAGAMRPAGVASNVRVIEPGWLRVEEVARLLSSGDLFLAPFTDGVSTRRTSVMAAMQHGIAIVGTHGDMTDSVLTRSGAMKLTPCGDITSFANAATALAEDANARSEFGSRAATLYATQFDWPIAAARMVAVLAEVPTGNSALSRRRDNAMRCRRESVDDGESFVA